MMRNERRRGHQESDSRNGCRGNPQCTRHNKSFHLYFGGMNCTDSRAASGSQSNALSL